MLWVKASGSGNTGWEVVYGDTDWQDISGGLINGWTGNGGPTGVAMRRINNMVYVKPRSLNGSEATAAQFVTITSRWRPDSADGGVVRFDGGSEFRYLYGNTAGAVFCATGAGAGSPCSTSWATSAAWPLTLSPLAAT